MKDTALLFLAGTIPIVLIGVGSMWSGGTFLPLPIWLKGHAPEIGVAAVGQWGIAGLNRLYENPFMLLMALCLLFVAANTHLRQNKLTFLSYLSLLVFLALMLHVWFAEVGGYRYEAYLIILGLTCLAKGSEEINWGKVEEMGFSSQRDHNRRDLFVDASILNQNRIFYPQLPPRHPKHLSTTTHDGEISADLLPKASVAANDVGAVSYFTEIQLTDLLGIADKQVAEFRKENQYSSEKVEQLSQERKIQIAIVHREWVKDYLPSDWIAVASWTIPNNFICAFDQVSWYAASENPEILRERLQSFESSLPSEVQVVYHP